MKKIGTCQRATGGTSTGSVYHLAQWRQLARRQFCGKLHVITPQKVRWKPPLRQAAGTLCASGGQRGGSGARN